MRKKLIGGVFVLLLFLSSGRASGQHYSSSIAGTYEINVNVTYLTIGGWEGKLDVYSRSDTPGPHPTLIYFHGGGAIGPITRKEYVLLDLLPYLEFGWNVVNVEYDLPGLTLAPIAVQNGLCAVRWVAENAAKYRIDAAHIYTSGFSSGGWIALMTAMAPANSAWEKPCPAKEDVRVAAVVNWSGETDFTEVLDGPGKKGWAEYWFQTLANPMEAGKSVSPVGLVRASVPPVISIHGDADPAVPYSQATKLHDLLRRAGVPERLLTVTGGGHGGYSRAQSAELFTAIKTFLSEVAHSKK